MSGERQSINLCFMSTRRNDISTRFAKRTRAQLLIYNSSHRPAESFHLINSVRQLFSPCEQYCVFFMIIVINIFFKEFSWLLKSYSLTINIRIHIGHNNRTDELYHYIIDTEGSLKTTCCLFRFRRFLLPLIILYYLRCFIRKRLSVGEPEERVNFCWKSLLFRIFDISLVLRNFRFLCSISFSIITR